MRIETVVNHLVTHISTMMIHLPMRFYTTGLLYLTHRFCGGTRNQKGTRSVKWQASERVKLENTLRGF